MEGTSAPLGSGFRAVGILVVAAVAGGLALAAHDGGPRSRAVQAASSDAGRDTTEFRHRDHRGVACLACHPSEESHGDLVVTSREDCLACHHRQDGDAPACTRCHSERGLRGATYDLRRPLELSTGTARERRLDFDHAEHESVACADCHAGEPALSAARLSCAECHDEHHEADSRCTACHVEAPDEAHPTEVVHVTCAGSGCHASMPFERVPRSNPACLGCHQEMADHRPGRPCVECHAMPKREPASRPSTRKGESG